jgi:hypothetical protein
MTASLIAICATALLILGSRRWLRAVLPREHDGLSSELLDGWLRDLLSAAVNSVIVIRVRGGPLCLQIRKRIRAGTPGIVLEYPRAAWSLPYFERVREEAVTHGTDVELLPAADGRKHELMLAFLGADVTVARELVLSILRNVYSASPETDCRAFLPSAREAPAGKPRP